MILKATSKLFSFIVKHKPTTFLLIGSLLFIVSLIILIYLSPKPGGEVGMYELECIMFLGIAVVMIFIDRILVVFLKYTWLSLFEFIAIIIVLLIYIDANKRARIIFTSHKYSYYMIIYSNKGFEKNKFVNEEMLDKALYVKDTNIVEINKKSLNGFYTYADVQFWKDSYRVDELTFKNLKLELYLSPKTDWTGTQIDSIYNVVTSKFK